MAEGKKTDFANEEFEWNADTKLKLSHAMRGHKPVGINKYFQMACITHKFRNSLNKDVPSKVVWEQLNKMYDMQAKDALEDLKCPNYDREFTLPENEFGSLMEEKIKEQKSDSEKLVKTALKEEVKQEIKKNTLKSVKELSKKKNKEHNENIAKKEQKVNKKIVKEKNYKDVTKEEKKSSTKEEKNIRKENKDTKENKEEVKKDIKETPKEVKMKNSATKASKSLMSRATFKDKKESKKEEGKMELPSSLGNSVKKERSKELSDSKINYVSPKRGGKQSTRGSTKPDDMNSNKRPRTVMTPSTTPYKRRRK